MVCSAMDAIVLNSSTLCSSVQRSSQAPTTSLSALSSSRRCCCQHRPPIGFLLLHPLAHQQQSRSTGIGWTPISGPLRRSSEHPFSTSDGLRVCYVAAPGLESNKAAADRRKARSDGQFTAHYHEHRDSNSSISAKATTGRTGWAREAVEANQAEASVSREDTSGAVETPEAATISGFDGVLTSTLVLDRGSITGGAVDFLGATLPLTNAPLIGTKKVVLVRHGLSSWNAEGRIQGSSDLSKLSDEGISQAQRCKQALTNLKFGSCFASPISRARTCAEVMWSGRDEPLVFLDTLKEAHLHFLEGMRNVDAKEQHRELYQAWREDPMNFQVNGVYPVVKLWAQAKQAWLEILSGEEELVLVVTHKSILRAMMCTALGMGPERFRAMDINNGGISVFTVNKRGEPMLQCLNMTSHLHVDGVFY